MKWTKKRVTNLFFLLGVAAVVVMLFTFDVSFVELWGHIKRAGLWLIPIVGVWIFVYAMNAVAWKDIINSRHRGGEGDERVGFWYIYKLTISGYALNYATPMGGLGGEPYRILELSKRVGNQRATSSVILYVMTHFLAHFSFWFFSIFVYLVLALHGAAPLTTAIKVFIGIIFVVCLLAGYVFSRGYKHGMVVKIIKFLGKLPGLKRWSARFLDKHSDSLARIDRQIAEMHSQDKRTFYGSLVMEFLARVVQSLEILFMLLLFGQGGDGSLQGLAMLFVYSMLIVAITTLLANIIGFLPMQLGVQEGGFVVSISLLAEPLRVLLGLPEATGIGELGIFVCIICRVREIIWIAIGLVLMKIGGTSLKDVKQAALEQKNKTPQE